MRKVSVLLFALLLMVPVVALADSINPVAVSGTLNVGDSVTITKTVTVNEGTPTTSKVDVFFLTDSTGSMGGLINSVKTSASAILTNTAGLGDVAFGVGEYKDVGDAFVYRLNQDITTSQAAAQAGINTWGASGGGDWYEANLYALQQVANTSSWRSGSARILVWFGDAPGHDPRVGATEASATAALVANGVQVEALDLGGMNLTGQATRITAATAGHVYSGINTAQIVTEISNAITTAFATYSVVELQTDGNNLPGVGVSFAPAAYNGAYDRSTTRTFDFSTTFTGLVPGVYDFEINALVGTGISKGIVATEIDHIVVRGDGEVPEPGTLLLLGTGLLGMAGYGWRRRSA